MACAGDEGPSVEGGMVRDIEGRLPWVGREDGPTDELSPRACLGT